MPVMTPAFTAVYNRYRAAKAEFDFGVYTAAQAGNDLPEGLADTLSDAHSQAMMALFVQPAANVSELFRKLEIYNLEGVYDSFRDARIISAALENDAHRLTFERG